MTNGDCKLVEYPPSLPLPPAQVLEEFRLKW